MAALLLTGASASHAQSPADPLPLRGTGNVPVYVEYDKKVRASEQLNPLGGELFGEDVSLYTGATEFSQVDIDIPGNNALPVQLRRRFVVSPLVIDQAHDPNGGVGNPYAGLGNWDIEVPMIYGTFDSVYGWEQPVGASSQAPRCSQEFHPRASQPTLSAKDIWSGNKVRIPGRGEKELLWLYPGYPPLQYPSDGRSPTWITSEFDAFTCTPHSAGANGEGFVMTTPDGITYTFDIYRQRAYASVEAGGHANPRKMAFLLASQVADRYGNTVSYTYNALGHPTQIKSCDGTFPSCESRTITLNYDPANPSLLKTASVQVAIPGQATQTRTWTYGYEVGAGGLRLATVTLPDGISQWTFDYNPGQAGNPDDLDRPEIRRQLQARLCVAPFKLYG